MASRLLTEQPMNAEVVLTVYHDAVKAEVIHRGRSTIIGWFRDEVSSLAAVVERTIMSSAILPELRRLPQLQVRCEYKLCRCDHLVGRFIRGTAVKLSPNGRRTVLLPGASSKSWLSV